MYYKIICLSIGLCTVINAMEYTMEFPDVGHSDSSARTSLASLNIDLNDGQKRRVILPNSPNPNLENKSPIKSSTSSDQKRKKSLKFPLKLPLTSSRSPRSSSRSHSEDSPLYSPKFMNPKSDDLSYLLCTSDLNPSKDNNDPYLNISQILVESKKKPLAVAKKYKLKGSNLCKIYENITEESTKDLINLCILNTLITDLSQFQAFHDLLKLPSFYNSKKEAEQANEIKNECYKHVRELVTNYSENEIKFPTYKNSDGEIQPLHRSSNNEEKYLKKFLKGNALISKKKYGKLLISTFITGIVLSQIEHTYFIREKIIQLAYNTDKNALNKRVRSALATLLSFEQ